MAWKIANSIEEVKRLYKDKPVIGIYEQDDYFWVELKQNGRTGTEKVLKPLSMEKVKQVLLNAGFPPVIVRGLEQTKRNELTQAVQKAMDKGKGLVLSGPAGVGKTHAITYAITQALRYYRIGNPLYISVPELDIKALRELYREADTIFIDDLNFVLREWVQDAIRELIYHCYNHQKPTFIASNRTFKSLAGEVLKEEPIISRLFAMCERHEVKGQDLRVISGKF